MAQPRVNWATQFHFSVCGPDAQRWHRAFYILKGPPGARNTQRAKEKTMTCSSNPPEEIVPEEHEPSRLSDRAVVAVLELSEADCEKYRLPGIIHFPELFSAPVVPMLQWGVTKGGSELSPRPPSVPISKEVAQVCLEHLLDGMSVAGRREPAEAMAVMQVLVRLIRRWGQLRCQWRRHVGPLGRSKTVPPGVFMFSEKVRANWPA